MDAIECGIVKLPRVPVADNIPGGEMPKFRNLWEHIRSKMPKKGRGAAGKSLDPLSLPVELQTALEALYGHYKLTYEKWQEAGLKVPPCFIVVCNNTSASKLVYDFISGYLARQNPESRVLLTTFSDLLARALQGKLRRLISNEPKLGERLEVEALGTVALRLHERHVGRVRVATEDQLRQAVAGASRRIEGHRFAAGFVYAEWLDVVDTWQISTWEGYRDFKRLGRKTRLSEAQRSLLWQIFETVATELTAQGVTTRAAICTRAAAAVGSMKHPPYDHVVIDEAQDVNVSQLRLLAAIAGGRPNGLLFAGDLGQRIFQTPFSWKSLGVDVRGRSRTLHVNYRTSHQIRAQADKLLGPEVSDVDGNVEDRRGTVSVFNGPAPEVRVFDDFEAEGANVTAWIAARTAAGVLPHELGVFVRSADQIPRAEAALTAAGLRWRVLDDKVDTASGQASISTMHLAKGLEFRCVVVMACDDEVIPLQERIEAVTDEADLEEVYHTERHLLYVACTRARDHLLVTAVSPGSEFLGDLLG